MANYILIYNGAASDLSEMTPEEGAQVLAKWQTWMGKVGSALVDIGSPFGPSTSLVDDGRTGSATALSGYSIVEADDLDTARQLAEGHPFLSEGQGNYAIDIFELMPVPFDN